MSTFYLVWPMTDEPVCPEEVWLRKFYRKHRYSCGHIDFTAWVDPIVVKDRGADVPLSFTHHVRFGCIRADFLRVLSPEIGSCLRMGTLIDAAAGPIDHVKTLWSGSRPFIRGGKGSKAAVCKTCGQLTYNPRGQWYVLSRELLEAPLFMSRMGGLIINEDLYKRLDGQQWKKVDIRKLTVLDEPRDGLPADLTKITATDL